MQPQIIFRQIDSQFPEGESLTDRLLRIRWHVEYYDDKAYPVGMAFLSMSEQSPAPTVEFIFVADQHRKRGIAWKMIEAIQERWPNIAITSAISEGGQALLDRFLREAGLPFPE